MHSPHNPTHTHSHKHLQAHACTHNLHFPMIIHTCTHTVTLFHLAMCLTSSVSPSPSPSNSTAFPVPSEITSFTMEQNLPAQSPQGKQRVNKSPQGQHTMDYKTLHRKYSKVQKYIFSCTFHSRFSNRCVDFIIKFLLTIFLPWRKARHGHPGQEPGRHVLILGSASLPANKTSFSRRWSDGFGSTLLNCGVCHLKIANLK